MFIADDDAEARSAIEAALRSVGLRAEAFASFRELVGHVRPEWPGCIILDLRADGFDGSDAQRVLDSRGCTLPVIVVTWGNDVGRAVRAMRAGAVDVLARPFSEQALLDDVHRALEADRRRRQQQDEIRELQRRYLRLTARAQEVMALVATGTSNRHIGVALGITERTVKAHRAQVMHTMRASSFVDLVRMTRDLAGAAPANPNHRAPTPASPLAPVEHSSPDLSRKR